MLLLVGRSLERAKDSWRVVFLEEKKVTREVSIRLSTSDAEECAKNVTFLLVESICLCDIIN